MTDSEKLRKLADWFDIRDQAEGSGNSEVQEDLRRIADGLEGIQNCAPKSLNQKQLLISFMESLTTEDITQIEIAEFDNVADKFLKQLEQ